MFLNENFQTEIYLELFADIQNLLNNFVNFRQLCGSSSSKAIKTLTTDGTTHVLKKSVDFSYKIN